MVGMSLTKLQSGSGPACSSPATRGPPENSRFGPSANRCLTAAVVTAATGIDSRQPATTSTRMTMLMTHSV